MNRTQAFHQEPCILVGAQTEDRQHQDITLTEGGMGTKDREERGLGQISRLLLKD